jgi:aryl-alcohol dehydrogenase-like predicted oxidoreductase
MSKHTTSRRNFLKSSVILPAAVAGMPVAAVAGSAAGAEPDPLPMRKLGKNGPMVTMLNIGGMMSAHNPQYLDLAWQMGIRYFDTADCYRKGQSEKDVGEWVRKYPERRKEVFIVTKDHPNKNPEQLLTMIDERLENMGIDYVDLFFIHGMSPKYGDDSLDSVEWPRSDRLKKVFEQLKASGKVKYCGFSCHDAKLVEYLHSAAEGGFIDAIMLKYDPMMQPGDDLDQAIEACHRAGIGLVAMKEMRPFAKAPKTHPGLEGTGLTTHQNVLQSVWSDKRIASICSAIENVQQMEENTMAARLYNNPIGPQARQALTEIAGMSMASMCPGCPSCNAWAKKTEYAFMDISRYVTYYEHDGNFEAREYFQSLHPRQRDPQGIDLARVSRECRYTIDYEEIARRSMAYFA